MRLIFFFVSFIISIPFFAQRATLGLLTSTEEVYDGFTLFSSVDYPLTYLIDNCGGLINSWKGDYPAGTVAYLIADGNLLITGKINDGRYGKPGKGGVMQIRNWNNELIWESFISNEKYGAHHDIKPISNGNFLALVWETKSKEEAIQAGRLASNIEGDIWPTAILEISPVFPDTFDIVWEWHLWDHLVQNVDTNKANYGIVENHPELVDINFLTELEDDWVHGNGLGYNKVRKEIIISSRSFNEFWIIDHSTTTEEAAGSTGGQSGKGGDLLYRWGNPRTYNRGDSSNQILVTQHNAEFMEGTDRNNVKISIFNNNAGIEAFSEVIEIEPKLDDNGNYMLSPLGTYTIKSNDFYRFNGNPTGAFDSEFMGFAKRLPNQNLLVCKSTQSIFIEYDVNGKEVWKYKSPINMFGVSEQGDSLHGRTFNLTKYRKDDAIFNNVNTSVKQKSGVLKETNFNCEQTATANTNLNNATFEIIYQNPVQNNLYIKNKENKKLIVEIYNLEGKEELVQYLNPNENLINTAQVQKGVKIVRILDFKHSLFAQFKIIKL